MIIDPDRVDVRVNALQGLVNLIEEGWPAAAIDGKRMHVPTKLQFAHGDSSHNRSQNTGVRSQNEDSAEGSIQKPEVRIQEPYFRFLNPVF
jgi:hypothetical protein